MCIRDRSIETENYRIVKEQEESLRFGHFDNEDAWKLGNIIVEQARAKQVAIAAEIWINGYQVFRYGFQGTNSFNDIWLRRKAVSYTHLDVYKRQSVSSATAESNSTVGFDRERARELRKRVKIEKLQMHDKATIRENIICPVSYTHLDVYKRQSTRTAKFPPAALVRRRSHI